MGPGGSHKNGLFGFTDEEGIVEKKGFALLNDVDGCVWFRNPPLLELELNSPLVVPLENPFDIWCDNPADWCVWKVPGLVENIELEVTDGGDCHGEAATAKVKIIYMFIVLNELNKIKLFLDHYHC